MSYEIRAAEKRKAKLKIGLAGPSSSGKTYSALLLAKGLVKNWSDVCVIDTENSSADLYADLGAYSVLPLEAPYSPENYIGAIEYAVSNGAKCVIIDSVSHEWMGTGGALEIHSNYGGKFQDWAKVTPKHKRFINAILQTDAHFICTSRVKTDWLVETNSRGKSEPRKVGLKSEQKEGLEYELTISFRLNDKHMATCDKDRTGMFSDKDPFLISEATGAQINDWYSACKDLETFDFKNSAHVKRVNAYLTAKKIPENDYGDVHEHLTGQVLEKKSIENAINQVRGVQ